MNASAKALQQGGLLGAGTARLSFSRESLCILLLLFCVMTSAIGVIFVKDYTRCTIAAIQKNYAQAQTLNLEWRQLLLERGTLATQARVQHLAQQWLGMTYPAPRAVILVKP